MTALSIAKHCLNYLSAETAGFYEFSLLELCGISSFNLSDEELAKWLLHFEKVYDVSLLPLPGFGTRTFTCRGFKIFATEFT